MRPQPISISRVIRYRSPVNVNGRNQSIVAFFGMVSDIVLKPGDFDFEEASKILNCERW